MGFWSEESSPTGSATEPRQPNGFSEFKFPGWPLFTFVCTDNPLETNIETSDVQLVYF